MSEKQYRLLNVGEVIQAGDECDVFGEWRLASASVGNSLDKDSAGYFRRPIEPTDDLRRQLDECRAMLVAARASEKSLAESNEKLSAEVGRLREENEEFRSANWVTITGAPSGSSDLVTYTAAHQPAEASPRERIVATLACGLIASGGEFDAKNVVRMADELIKEMSK